MTIEYDEKGKIFTNVIAKTATPVIIQTLTHQIKGCVYVKTENRLKDELDSTERFLAVTDAVIYGNDHEVLSRVSFLLVHIAQLVWILPETELSEEQDSSGGPE